MTDSMLSGPAKKFPPGRFQMGDPVRLRHPEEHVAFEDPGAVLEVVGVHYFRLYAPPTYVLRDPAGCTAIPFRDEQLLAVEDRAPELVTAA